MKYTILLLLFLAACATGPSRYQLEAQAYAEYVASEVNAGRMTNAQAKYLITQKLNQLVSQKNADEAASDANAINALGVYNQMSRPQGNTINCTTTQMGPFGNISCQ